MSTLLHAIGGYFVLLLTIRLLRRRPGSQMTMFEFVLIFLIGGVIIAATMGQDRSVTNATCAVVMVGLLHRLVSWLRVRSSSFEKLVDGTPLILYKTGTWQAKAMHEMKLTPDDVLAAARSKGIQNLDNIDYAVLERNGQISLLSRPAEEQSHA
jgi:uncharacterized membrane protein YcaP (DUF421 family)